jgi:hypothetical protein
MRKNIKRVSQDSLFLCLTIFYKSVIICAQLSNRPLKI